MVADGRLGQPDRVREYAATFLTTRGGEQHREQLDPDRVAEHPEAKRHLHRGDVANGSCCDRSAMQGSCGVSTARNSSFLRFVTTPSRVRGTGEISPGGWAYLALGVSSF